MAPNSGRFRFDGGAATFVGTALLGALITLVTAGVCYPFALVLMERWRAKHSFIDGRPLVFTGSAWGLFGHWLKWLLLSFLTAGIYLLWVIPRITQWKWEHTDFDPAHRGALVPPDVHVSITSPTTPLPQATAPSWAAPPRR
jgi:uncharacterized membrane protein YjgN (DUF898 family)